MKKEYPEFPAYSITEDGKVWSHRMTHLKESDVRMIIYMYRTGLFLQKEIGKFYGIADRTVCAIVNKESWRHLWHTKITLSI